MYEVFVTAEPAEALTSGRPEIQPVIHRLLIYYSTYQMGAVTAARGGMEAGDGNQIHIGPSASLHHPSPVADLVETLWYGGPERQIGKKSFSPAIKFILWRELN